MKIILLGLITLSFLNANKVYDISQEEYKLYKNDKEKMLEIFKSKYIENNGIDKNKLIVIEEHTVLDDKNISNEEIFEEIIVENKHTFIDNNISEKDVNSSSNVVVLNQGELENLKLASNIKKESIEKSELELKYNLLVMKNKNLEDEMKKRDLLRLKAKNTDDKFKGMFEQTKSLSENNETVVSVKKVLSTKKNTKNTKYIKMLKIYTEKELDDKLSVEEVQKQGNTVVYMRSIDKVLKNKNIKYERAEIKQILDLINKKVLSRFESTLYLEQIKNLIKG